MVMKRRHETLPGDLPRQTCVRDRLSKNSRRSSTPLPQSRQFGTRGVSVRKSRRTNSPRGEVKEKISSLTEEHSGAIDGDDGDPSLSKVVLKGTIPDVLEWTRGVMDVKNFSPRDEENEDEELENSKESSARKFAHYLHANHSFRLLNQSTYWKTEVRLWENICAFAAKLPSAIEARILFETMRRYPSSVLVHWGLKIVFGRYMAIGGKKMKRLSLRQNAIALFSPSLCNKKSVKEWFESDTHVRLQETVLHMCALSEYILRCACIAKQRRNPSCFPNLVEERIEAVRDHRKLQIVRFVPWNILMELSEEDAAVCLEAALLVANTAVIEGAKAAYKKYGRKRTGGKQREKITMSLLRRPLAEIMDRVIKGLEDVILDEIKIAVDIDYYRLQATRTMRKIIAIYVDLANVEANGEDDTGAKRTLPDDCRQITTNPYMYSEPL